MNLVLIGYRATGKSTVAGLLGRRLGWPVVSTDEAVVQIARHGIPELVQRFGWEYFRDLESAVIEKICRRDHTVIDCGGGAVLRSVNAAELKRHGFIVLLSAAVQTIVERLQGDTERPSLTGRGLTEEVADVLRVRQPIYSAAADAEIRTDGLTPNEVLDLILRRLPAKFHL